jgi:pimeloyl-ACP methyl ester carboxylesterase
MTDYKTVDLGGRELFYREAGDNDAPTLLLLHGFPTSSAQYQTLIDRLAGRFHLVAPDYPGFGQSKALEGTSTFDRLTDTIEQFVDALGIEQATLYMFDFGGPVGLRLATRRPGLVEGLIVQNANAYEAGFGPAVAGLQPLWDDPVNGEAEVRPFLSLEGTKSQYLTGVLAPELVNPDLWTLDQYYLDQPGRDRVMLDLLKDYPTNVGLYPSWHDYLRVEQPPTLIVWGANDPFFTADGARAYLTDLPDARLRLFNTGHFALATHVDEIAQAITDFVVMSVNVPARAA